MKKFLKPRITQQFPDNKVFIMQPMIANKQRSKVSKKPEILLQIAAVDTVEVRHSQETDENVLAKKKRRRYYKWHRDSRGG